MRSDCSERARDESETLAICIGRSLCHFLAGEHILGFHQLCRSVRRHPYHFPLLPRGRFHLIGAARTFHCRLLALRLGGTAPDVPPLFPLLHTSDRIHASYHVQHLHRSVCFYIRLIPLTSFYSDVLHRH